jgi:hypothetical protein
MTEQECYCGRFGHTGHSSAHSGKYKNNMGKQNTQMASWVANIHKEWVGTSWPCTQLQEAIRTAKVSESCRGLAMRPKGFLVKFARKVWYYMHMKIWVQHFNAVRPFETFWIFTGNEWGPADHVRSCKKPSELPKTVRVAVGWLAMQPRRFL